jgi:NAD+ kinase
MESAVDVLRGFAAEHPGVRIFLNKYLRNFADRRLRLKSDAFLGSKVDALLSLGGDGTFLAAARLVRGEKVPILGVNLGRVGFLADATLENLRPILEDLLRRDYTLRRRMLLQVEHWRGRKRLFRDIALNEVAFTGEMGHQMVEIEVKASGRFLTIYRVDGLLMSTPTGSTAYSLSAGGPIIHPSGQSILLTPMNPASLSVRPLVLPDSMEIEARSAMTKDKVANLFVDGRHRGRLLPGDVLRAKKNPEGLRIIRPHSGSYFESLRTKLGWTGSRG